MAKPVLVDEWVDLFDRGNVILFGQTGSGKTSFLERVAQKKWERKKCKVICFDFKHEACQLGFPETGKHETALIAKRTHGSRKPRPYPHKVFVPFALSSFEKAKNGVMRLKLPRHSDEFIELQRLRLENGKEAGYTYWRPFKLAFSDISASDFVILLRRATEAGVNTLELLSRVGRYKSLPALMKEIVQLIAKDKSKRKYVSVEPVGFSEEQVKADAEIGNYSTYVSILTLLANVERSGFICTKDDEFALDLAREMRNTDEWITFSFNGVDTGLAALAVQAIERNILRLRKSGHFPPLVLVKPEESVFAPRFLSDSMLAVSGVSPLPLEKFFLSQSRILGVTTICDVQVPRQLSPTVISHFRWVAVGRNNAQAVQDIHENIISVPPEIKRKFPHLESGTWAVFKLGLKDYWYPFFACPSLAYHKKEGQDVLDWTRRQAFVELVEYESPVSESIKVSFKKMFSKEEKELKKDLELAKEIVAELNKGKSKSAVCREKKMGKSRLYRLLDLARKEGIYPILSETVQRSGGWHYSEVDGKRN